MPRSKCRLFCILARKSRAAVILRRGPSSEVLLVHWDRATDRFHEGQWLRGRIYERRCDLSPSGTHLVYFAAQWRRPMQTWTAVSRVPWLTALALFPKGDAYGGGGLFEGESTIALNHPYTRGAPVLAEGTSLPRGMKVKELGLASGAGEDFPLYGMRLLRDGWTSRDALSRPRLPVVSRKRQPRGKLELEMTILSVAERSGPGDWWVVEHALWRHEEPVLLLGRTEWADWDENGDLLYARDGVLHRLARASLARPTEDAARVLVDLRDRVFVARKSPPDARRW